MLQNFIGNEGTIEILRKMLESGKLPHAIMLEGDDGLGKHTIAAELSRAILCDEAAEYCGSCRNCTLFSAGSHPDYSLISPNQKNLIPVDTIRALRKKAFERPDRAAKKVYVIENAQRMNREGQNAFLKILEEPPEYVVFILLAESASAFLDTIISRCTVFRLNQPPYTPAFGLIKAMLPEKSDEEIDIALSENENNIGKTLKQLQSEETSAISRTAAELITIIGGRRGYECLKILHKFERDPAGLTALLSALRSRAAIELRNLSMGKGVRHTLSRKDLVEVIEAIDVATRYLSQNAGASIVITRLCSALIK